MSSILTLSQYEGSPSTSIEASWTAKAIGITRSTENVSGANILRISKLVRLGEAFVVGEDIFVDVAVRLSGLGDPKYTLRPFRKSRISPCLSVV